MTQQRGRFFDSELHKRLRKTYLKTFALRFISGLLSFLAVASWGFLAVVLWTLATNNPPLLQALIVSRATLIILGLLFAYFVILPLVRMPRFGRFTREVENQKDFKDILTSAYEFSEKGVSDRYSSELINEVIRQAIDRIARVEVRFLFLTRRQIAFVPVIYLALIVLIVLAFVRPSGLINAGKRVVEPRAVAAVPGDANLHAIPGNITILSGSDLEVSALDFGGSDEDVRLSYNMAESFWKTEPTARDQRLLEGELMDEYTYTFRDVRNTITYYFESGKERSPEYRITVVNKPIVTDLTVVLTPPEYTGDAPETLIDNGGNIQALEGTHVSVTARSNNPLANAWVQFDGSEGTPLDVVSKTFSFEFTALEDGSYGILLEDEMGHGTDQPLEYSIEVYADNAPILDVLEPGGDATLPRNLKIDVGFIASDDYGIEQSEIYFRKSGEEYFQRRVVPLGADKGETEIAKRYTWDLSDVALFPGNYIEYFVQVEDNNVVTGPGITKSRVFHITVPTMAELYEKAEEDESSRTDMLEEARRESEEMRERMEKLSREFEKTRELDWAQKKEVDKAIASQENIQEKLEDVQSSLEETLESLSDNKMTSQEIGEKMEEIQKLIDNINDEALNEYVEQLKQAMEQMDPEQIQEALENLELSAEDLLKSLERTENLLKEIQREQAMEEAIRKTQELLEKQEELSDRTGESDAQDNEGMNELSEEQEALAEEAEQLEEDIGEMSEQFEQDSQDANDKQEGDQQSQEQQDKSENAERMKEGEQEFEESETSETMKDASKNLKEGEKSEAQQNQQQAMDNLISLFSKLNQMQMDMQMQSQRRATENLQRLARSTLDLSFKQERLTERLRTQASELGGDIDALAKEQLSYANAVGQIANELEEIGQRTMMVPQELMELLGATMHNMRQTMLLLEQRKAFMSTTSATQSVTKLNEATIELLSAAQQMSQGGGQGQGQPQSAMQQMMQGQQDVLQQSQKLMAQRAMQEKMLQEQQAEMQRLLGQQRSLRDLAEEIDKGSEKDGERILGNMDKIIEEMDEVIRDMESGNIDESTLRNEERIVSRMLDAQRSVHSRDYEKKRESMAADDVYSDVPDMLSQQRSSNELREDIRRAMNLKAPGEYEELIKLYFRALAEESPAESR